MPRWKTMNRGKVTHEKKGKTPPQIWNIKWNDCPKNGSTKQWVTTYEIIPNEKVHCLYQMMDDLDLKLWRIIFSYGTAVQMFHNVQHCIFFCTNVFQLSLSVTIIPFWIILIYSHLLKIYKAKTHQTMFTCISPHKSLQMTMFTLWWTHSLLVKKTELRKHKNI